MALIAHTFRIEPETLDDLKARGNGNESLGCRLALERLREWESGEYKAAFEEGYQDKIEDLESALNAKQSKTFAWGMLAGFVVTVIAHLVFFAAAAP